MTRRLWAIVGVLLVTFLLSGCGDDGLPSDKVETAAPAQSGKLDTRTASATAQSKTAAEAARWYESERVERGAVVYAQNCTSCHGDGAQGTFAWRKRDADGNFPPPPLDGTAHSWHHPIRALGSQIKFGAPGGQGKMPGFAETLSDEQVLDVIAWFQSKWPDEIYAAWLDIEMRSRTTK